MIERTDRRRGTPTMRVAWVSLLVATGVGVVGVVPALAADRSPAPAAVTSDHDRDRGRGHDRWFRDHGDVRYVWFRVCDGTTTTSTTTAPETTTETVATDALAAAVEGAAAETATTTDTATDTTTGTTTADDDPDAEEYPTFVVVPMPKDEAASLRKLDDRSCYDLTTGAPRTTATTTSAATTDSAVPDTATTTTTPAPTGTTG
jgi:hypothetical protein